MISIRTLAAVTVILFAVVGTGRSQQTDTTTSSSRNSLKPGAWALQFGINRDFQLSSFQGAIISAKYQLSRERAVRLGLSLSGNFKDNTDLGISYADTLRSGNSSSGSTNSFSLAIQGQYLYYPNPGDEVHIFLGSGPVVSYSQFSSDASTSNTSAPNYSTTSTQTIRSSSWALGVSGLAGVEWFFAQRFSLHAEYGLVLQYAWTDWTNDHSDIQQYAFPFSVHSYSDSHDTSSKGWQFTYNSVNFGLSVYF